METLSPKGDNIWLNNYSIFRAVTQKLARIGGWQKLASVTGHALINAPYSTGETRAALLLDLARIYRDRLNDEKRAEESFAALVKADPASAEALAYLAEVYQARGDWGSIYDLNLAAVDASWDRNERLAWTREAAEIATEKMNKIDLAIKAWERF